MVCVTKPAGREEACILFDCGSTHRYPDRGSELLQHTKQTVRQQLISSCLQSSIFDTSGAVDCRRIQDRYRLPEAISDILVLKIIIVFISVLVNDKK